MSDIIDVSAVLVKMAASPDPGVRASAVRYKQMVDQLRKLEGLIAFYGQACAELESAPRPKAKPVMQQVARSGPANHEVNEFVGRLSSILETCGGPTKFNKIYDLYYQNFPAEERLPKTTFRQRLTKKPAVFRSVDRKYWLTNRDVPASNGQARDVA